MKYLKTYKSINESTLGDLTFEDFQDLFVDVTDKFDNVTYFHHESEDVATEGINAYLISIKIDIEYIEGNDFDILNTLRDFSNIDDPLDMDEENFVSIFDKIDDNLGGLIELKNKIDSVIDKNKDIKNIIDEIKYVFDRLKKFSNYKEIQLGFCYDEIALFYLLN